MKNVKFNQLIACGMALIMAVSTSSSVFAFDDGSMQVEESEVLFSAGEEDNGGKELVDDSEVFELSSYDDLISSDDDSSDELFAEESLSIFSEGDVEENFSEFSALADADEQNRLRIIIQPVDVTCEENAIAKFSVKAEGKGLTYKWQYSDNEGTTWATGTVKTADYSTTATAARHGRLLRCIVTDSYGDVVISDSARLLVIGCELKITSQPKDVICEENATARFNVTVVGTGLTYKWQYSDNEGVTWTTGTVKTANYSTNALSSRHCRLLRCIVTDSYGNEVVSESARLIISGGKLKITSQPKNVICEENATAKFSVTAVGVGLTYRWQYSDNEGVTWTTGTVKTANYSTTATAARHGRLLRCIVMDSYGNEEISESARLIVSGGKLKITSQPKDVICEENATARFSVTALGTGLLYKWQYSDNGGATWTTGTVKTANYSTTATAARHGRLLRCIVTDSTGKEIVSEPACLLIIDAKPSIKSQPKDVICEENVTAKFSISAVGTGLTYKWQYSDNEGATWATGTVKTASYSTTATVARHGRLLRCIVTDSTGKEIVSEPARLLVKGVKPIIRSQPKDVICEENATARFGITAVGTGLTYKWQYSDNEGATWATGTVKTAGYSTTATVARHGRLLRCIVTDSTGKEVISEPARLLIKGVKPIIRSQPKDVICEENATARFGITAVGTGLTYKWQYSDNEGATWATGTVKTANYSTTATASRHGRLLRCIVTDTYGNEIISESARLLIESKLKIDILKQPENVVCSVGNTAEFSVMAEGISISYQWQFSQDSGKNWKDTDSKESNYKFIVANEHFSWQFRCIILDAYGNREISKVVVLDKSAELITIQPRDWTGCENAKVYFHVATNEKNAAFQWQYSENQGGTWKNSSVTKADYTATALSSYNGRLYRCIVTSEDGNQEISSVVRLSISNVFRIVVQPEKCQGNLDETVYMEIQAGGDDLSYEWQISENGNDKWSTVTTTNTASQARLSQRVAPYNIGKFYRCIIRNSDGSTLISNVVQLTWINTGFFDYGDYRYFVEEDGLLAVGWKTIDTKLYSFRDNGTMRTGIFMIDGKRYHFDSISGVAMNGFVQEESGYTYYYDGLNGALTGLQTIEGKIFYLGDNGALRYGLRTINDKIYYFQEDGTAAKGFTYVPEKFYTYYFDSDGAARIGWTEIDNQTYYFYPNGSMAHGITQIGSGEYYFDFETGIQMYGLIQVGLSNYMYFERGAEKPFAGLKMVNGKLYYFSEKENSYGVTLSGMQVVDENTYYFDPDTKQAVTGFIENSGYTYYMGSDFKMMSGSLLDVEGKKYLLSESGTVQYGMQTIDGKRYYFVPDSGEAISGWRNIDGYTYFFDLENFTALTGLQVIDGKNYFFNNSGRMATGLTKIGTVNYYAEEGEENNGFKQINGRTYYVNEDQTVAVGLKKIDGNMYYFSDTGSRQTGFRIINNVRYFFDLETGAAVTGMVTMENGRTYYFAGEKGTLTGLQKINGELYYLSSTGTVQYGRIQVGDAYYFFDTKTGKAVSGWKAVAVSSGAVYKSYYDPVTYQAASGLQKIEDRLYCFDESGWALSGKRTVDGVTYYFAPSTYEAYTGWYRSSGGYHYYYDGENGMCTGPALYEIDGSTYYFSADGVRGTGLQIVNGVRMYFDTVTAEIVTGFVFIEDENYTNGGKTYYFDGANGALYGLQTIEGNQYYFNSYGIMQYGFQLIDGVRCYFDNITGIRTEGVLLSESNQTYYLFDSRNASGVGNKISEYGNVLYLLNNSGTLKTGYCSTDVSGLNYRVYLDDETGEQQFGLITYTNSSGTSYTYYFQKDDCQSSVGAIRQQLEAALAQDGWTEVGGLTYYIRNGAFLKGIQTVNNSRYYFSNMTGAMLSGLRRIGSDYYYFDESSGKMLTGWVEIEGKSFYFDPQSGKQLTGITKINGDNYYLLIGGSYAVGIVQVGSDQYEFSDLGVGTIVNADSKIPAPVQAENAGSWGELDGVKCYYGANGQPLEGFQTINGVLYYFDQDGKMKTGFIMLDGATYYFTENGAAQGLVEIGKEIYYFSPKDFSMLTGMQEIDGKYRFFNETGIMQKGWITLNGNKQYYLTEENGVLTGLQTIEGKRYLFNSSGVMSTGVQIVETEEGNQKVFLFGDDGAMITGLVQSDDGLYYYDETTGERVTEWVNLNEEEYYFNPLTGKASTGLVTIDGFNYYFNPETAKRELGLQKINDKIYCFNDDPTGDGFTYGLNVIDGKTYCFSEITGIARKGYYSLDDVRYYFDSETGASVSGIYRLESGNVYAFKEGGGTEIGWVESNGKHYYFYPATGFMAEGLASIGDTLYYFDFDDGYLCNTTVKVGGITYAIDKEGSAKAVGDSKIVNLINAGIERLGKAYGEDDSDVDLGNASSYSCSQLIVTVFAEIGIDIRTDVYLQHYSLLHGNYEMELVDNLSNAQAGDIIYYSIVDCKYGDSCSFWNEIHHVGVYLGDGKILESTEVSGDEEHNGVMIRDSYDTASCFVYQIVRLNDMCGS
ncbi:MAG: NlpC/P60 family protein [Eubacteriales bacterium]|nr:NlpC/P60 family protein [Eubacteriales bacterium]